MPRFAPRAPRPSFSTLAALAVAACVCPPCPESVVPVKLEVGARLVLWNGDGEGQGASPKGWESCDAKPCVAKFAQVAGEGKDGSHALHFQVDGSAWLGGGWNLFGWWPEDAGIDVSGYDTLQFMLRVKAPSAELRPDELSTGLGGSGENNSGFVPISKFDKNFNDGEWHVIEIPIAELQKGDGKNFNPQSIWEFRLNTWSAAPKKFDAYVDEVAVVKRR